MAYRRLSNLNELKRTARRRRIPLAAGCLVFLVLCWSIASPLWGETPPDLQTAARRLLDGVVTVRVRFAETADEGGGKARVVVCSGVVVGSRWVVTPVFAGADSQVKITLPTGTQVDGEFRVVDEYSGLAMIRLRSAAGSPLPLAARLPAVGSWVVSAAGWGAEKPVVSLGIVSGHQRTDPGLLYPPLLQCDLRAATTSSGAAVVDPSGALVGVVVVTGTDRSAGFSFAVPVEHVRRLLRVAEEAKSSTKMVVLKRRRPEVGMVLDGQPDAVKVVKVTRGSPADRAGIVVGDRVVAVNGVHIRSVYQAVRPVLVRQPGDRVTFTIERSGERRDIGITLGGGVELSRARLRDIAQFVQPKIDMTNSDLPLADNSKRRPNPAVAATKEDTAGTDSRRRALLEKSLDRYQAALRILQQRLQQSEAERRELQREIRELQREVKALRARSDGK